MTIAHAAALLFAQASVPPPVIDMPPIMSALPRAPAQQQFVRWVMSPVICRDAGLVAQTVTMASAPMSSLTWPIISQRRTLSFDFRIDATGRPLSIARGGPPSYIADAQDVAPALAATRFAPGRDRGECTVTFTASVTPIAAAPLVDLMAYSVFPTGSTPNRQLWDRIRPPGSSCTDPVPDVLIRAFPAFKTLPDQPGYRSWSMTGFDIDAAGKPTHLHTIAGSGVTTLDAAARAAVGRSRFERGRRTGCLYPYYKGAAVLAAPEPPEEDSARPADATCPRDHGWSRAPSLVYPDAYRRRSIEGWALVAYDVAPWGQTGNVRVLRAEPTADFGEAAAAMIRNATHSPSRAGYTGCTERVRYVIGKPGMPAAVEPVEPVS